MLITKIYSMNMTRLKHINTHLFQQTNIYSFTTAINTNTWIRLPFQTNMYSQRTYSTLLCAVICREGHHRCSYHTVAAAAASPVDRSRRSLPDCFFSTLCCGCTRDWGGFHLLLLKAALPRSSLLFLLPLLTIMSFFDACLSVFPSRLLITALMSKPRRELVTLTAESTSIMLVITLLFPVKWTHRNVTVSCAIASSTLTVRDIMKDVFVGNLCPEVSNTIVDLCRRTWKIEIPWLQTSRILDL